MKYIYLLILTIVICGHSFQIYASMNQVSLREAKKATSGILANADRMSRDSVKQIVELEGNVQVVFKGQILTADQATVFLETKEVEAIGNVVLKDLDLYAEGDRLHFNYETNLGTLYNGFVQSEQVVFEGKIIEKVGPQNYIASGAQYTACVTCPPAWSFSGSKIDAEFGGYAHISKPVLRLAGVPVLILPHLVVPLKSERQSGFLVPSWYYSSTGGFAISSSFFWAISKSKDLTITAKNYAKRGLKGLSEYRYVLTPESRGYLRAATIKDKAFQKNLDDSSIDRWFVDYRHYYLLPENIVNRVQLQTSSDLRYPRDFPDEMAGHGSPALENRVSLSRNTENHHMSAEAGLYINLLKEDPLANNEDAVHRLPDIKYSLVEQSIGDSSLLFKTDVNYVHFTRDGFSYDNINKSDLGDTCPPHVTSCIRPDRTGEFNPEKDLIRTGRRLDIRPSLSYPVDIGPVLRVMPSVSYRETQYQFMISDPIASNENYSNSAALRYLETNISAKTQVSRVFGDQSSHQGRRYKHEIEPEITYSTIPWTRRPEHAFFGTSRSIEHSRRFEPISDDEAFGRSRLQFDYNDRLFDKRLLDLGITNRLVRRRWRGGQPDYNNIVTFRVSQSYDFDEAKAPIRPQPWSAINALLDIRLDNFETNTQAVYYPYAQVTNTFARARIMNDRGHYFQLSHNRSFLITEENQVDYASRTENTGAAIGYRNDFININGHLDYSNVTHQLTSWMYTTTITPPGNCWSFFVMHQQIIGGDRQISFNIDFKFDGKTSTGFSPAL